MNAVHFSSPLFQRAGILVIFLVFLGIFVPILEAFRIVTDDGFQSISCILTNCIRSAGVVFLHFPSS